MDKDFERLLKGDVKLADLTPEQKNKIKQRVLDLDAIRDPVTREIMKRWEKYFTETK